MYDENISEESHTITSTDEDGKHVVLPFFLKGVTSHLNVSPLSQDEYEHHVCPSIELMSHHLT